MILYAKWHENLTPVDPITPVEPVNPTEHINPVVPKTGIGQIHVYPYVLLLGILVIIGFRKKEKRKK